MTLELPQGFWVESVDSTMDEARRLIQAGRIQGTAFVWSDHQTQGRGTRGRQWSSPKGQGIYLSVVHRPPEGSRFELTPLFTLAAGVACVEALALCGVDTVRLKPVNDLYAHGRKLGGILVESDVQSEGITTLITGIGLNLHPWPHELDRQVVAPISVRELMPEDCFAALNPEDLVERVVAKVCFWYALLFQGNHGQVQRAWDRYKLPPLEETG